VSLPADDTTLKDHEYVTLILRLTLDREGRLIQGELVDTKGTRNEWFIGASGLNQAVAAWLKQQEQSAADIEA
jgi:hypothetical protein